MFISKMMLPRRTFLRGLGATIALPFLDAMVPALSAASPTPITRLGFVYVPNGIQLANWIPKTVGANFETTPILAPLEPFRKQLTIISGLSNPGEMLDDGGGAHTRPHTMWLSGIRPVRTQGGDIQAGTTIDQIAAESFGKETPLRSLEIALEPNFLVGNCETGYSCTYMNTFSWRSPTTPNPMENNPRVVFERLFGEGGKAMARIKELRRDRSILDSVLGDLSRLERSLGPGDRHTISAYVDSIREFEQRLQRTEQRAANSPETPLGGPLGVPPSFKDHAEMMFDLQLLAYQGDVTRVVSFQMARELSSRAYPEVGVAEAHHDISHHQNNPERMEKNSKINTFHVGLFAHLLERMANTPDGDGTLLDHSIMMFGAGLGDGDQHSPFNLPVALVGSGNGVLKGNRHLQCQLDTPMMNFGVTLLSKVGVPVTQLANSTGQLAEL